MDRTPIEKKLTEITLEVEARARQKGSAFQSLANTGNDVYEVRARAASGGRKPTVSWSVNDKRVPKRQVISMLRRINYHKTLNN